MKNRMDDDAMNGAELFFLFVIIILILMTGGMVYALQQFGPENEVILVIEDVYIQDNRAEEEDDFTAHVYVSNLGIPDAEAEMKWRITEGDRLIGEGDSSIGVEGRRTSCDNFDIPRDIEPGTEYEIEIEIVHDDQRYESKTIGFTP